MAAPPSAGRSRRLVGVVFIGLVLVAAALAVYHQYASNNQQCVVGITGTHALIEVNGSRAEDVCNQMVTESNYEYHYSGSITEAPVCEYSIAGRRFDTYDEGILSTVGNEVCKVLALNEVPVQTTPP